MSGQYQYIKLKQKVLTHLKIKNVGTILSSSLFSKVISLIIADL